MEAGMIRRFILLSLCALGACQIGPIGAGVLPPPQCSIQDVKGAVIGPLPTNFVAWEHSLDVEHVHRVTLGVEYLYVEADDGKLFAINRFTGFVVWVWMHPRGINASWAPSEVPDVILARLPKEAEEAAVQQRIREETSRTKPDAAVLEPLRRRRSELGDSIRLDDASDHLILIADNTMHFLERRTGREMWSTRLQFMAAARPTVNRTHAYVPCADPPRVYQLSIDRRGVQTNMYRVTIETRDNFVSERAIFHDPNVIFASHDGALYGFNSSTGNLTWAFETHDTIRSEPTFYNAFEIQTDAAGGNPRRVDHPMVFTTALNRTLYAVETSGNLVWKYALGGFCRTPVIGCRGVVYVKTENDALLALEARPTIKGPAGQQDRVDRNGRLKWRLPMGQRFVAPLRNGRVLVEGTSCDLVVIEEATGKIVSRHSTHPLSYIVTNTQDETVYAVTEAGHIFALREPPIRD